MTRGIKYSVPVASDLILEGRTYRVEDVSDEGFGVRSIADGAFDVFPFAYVYNSIAEGCCTVITPLQAEKKKILLDFTGGVAQVEQVSSFERKVIRATLAVMLVIKNLEEEGDKLTQRYLDKPEIRALLRRRAIEMAGDSNLFWAVDDAGEPRSIAIAKGRTLQRYRELLKTFDGNPVVLLTRNRLKGPRGNACKKICDLGERFIEEVIDYCLTVKKPKVAVVYWEKQKEFFIPNEDRIRDFCFPSLTTIRSRLKRIPKNKVAVRLDGRREAANKMMAGSTAIQAVEFGEYVETDQCLLSIFVDASGTVRPETWKKEEQQKDPHGRVGKPRRGEREVIRVWLSYVMDVATRMPLGWQLSETATAEATMHALRMAMRSKEREKLRYGCELDPAPAVGITEIRADNGTAVRNAKVFGALGGLGATLTIVRAFAPADKPFVERMFGTIDVQVLNSLAGYAGSKPGALPGADPMGEASLPPEDLYGILTRFFIDKYPTQPHRGTGMMGATPLQKLEECKEKYWANAPPSPEMRRLHLGLTTDLTITSEGVAPFRIPFNSSALQSWANSAPSRKVTVHLDPDDLKRVTITPPGTSDVITADLTMTNFRDSSLENALRLLKEASLRKPESSVITNDDVAATIACMERKASPSQRARLPENFHGIARLEELAAQLENVEARPTAYPGHTGGYGSITDCMTDLGASDTGRTLAPGYIQQEPPSSEASQPHPLPCDDAPTKNGATLSPDDIEAKPSSGPEFGPIKGSKF